MFLTRPSGHCIYIFKVCLVNKHLLPSQQRTSDYLDRNAHFALPLHPCKCSWKCSTQTHSYFLRGSLNRLSTGDEGSGNTDCRFEFHHRTLDYLDLKLFSPFRLHFNELFACACLSFVSVCKWWAHSFCLTHCVNDVYTRCFIVCCTVCCRVFLYFRATTCLLSFERELSVSLKRWRLLHSTSGFSVDKSKKIIISPRQKSKKRLI